MYEGSSNIIGCLEEGPQTPNNIISIEEDPPSVMLVKRLETSISNVEIAFKKAFRVSFNPTVEVYGILPFAKVSLLDKESILFFIEG